MGLRATSAGARGPDSSTLDEQVTIGIRAWLYYCNRWFLPPYPPNTHPTSRDILERCVHGLTQNANESFHSMTWSRARKAKFAGFTRLSFVAELAILDHNFGYQKASLLKSFKVNSKALRKSLSQQDKEKRHSKGNYNPKTKKKKTNIGRL
ncbi:hypothetical protein GWK47_040031 [Chionoecetes opilio]|uniref:Uncharacterized protein n=1 Tax=Chionoecetes opilio TaxID=41210 RepID=A0A8J5CXT9_CHIOP|nr:hypothetical protein GWK47_040031 [Chionoecetes opilio]